MKKSNNEYQNPSNAGPQYKTEPTPDVPVELYSHRPREILVDGKRSGLFHFTRLTLPAAKTEPIGYCADNCAGHADPGGARAHFKRYLLDQELALASDIPELAALFPKWRACMICGKECAVAAFVFYENRFRVSPGMEFYLCPEHATVENVDRLLVVEDIQFTNWFSHPTGELRLR